ncbi:MAG TPA: hypothetical protein VJ729_13950 [Nitrososphaeraceae archaeon]|nr:hypothetical protein [Nitrososphaeraceae archaeon]
MNATTNLSKPKSKGKEITTRPSTTLSIEHIAINNDVPTAAQQIVRSIKSIPGRVDCNFFNYYYYCSQCGLKLPKNILRCISCKQKVRTESVYLFLMSSKKTKCVEELNIITGINSINMPVIQVTISH